jgi:hypothetical protein
MTRNCGKLPNGRSFCVQRELESVADAEKPAIVLCDRGTVDGSAYWFGAGDPFSSVGANLDEHQTLLMPAEGHSVGFNVPNWSLSLAGFEVIIYGRFWVIAEVTEPERVIVEPCNASDPHRIRVV